MLDRKEHMPAMSQPESYRTASQLMQVDAHVPQHESFSAGSLHCNGGLLGFVEYNSVRTFVGSCQKMAQRGCCWWSWRPLGSSQSGCTVHVTKEYKAVICLSQLHLGATYFSSSFQKLMSSASFRVGVQVDEMKVYWSEPWQQRIMRCTLNGTDLELDSQRCQQFVEEKLLENIQSTS